MLASALFALHADANIGPTRAHEELATNASADHPRREQVLEQKHSSRGS